MSAPLSLLTSTGDFTQLSVTQVEKADPKQTGGCLRKWWFEVPNGLKPEQSYEKNEGTAGHDLLRRYFLTGERPQGRVLMGKAVTAAILKGDLPTPGDDLIVERRFSGQEMRDQNRCECGHLTEDHGKKGCIAAHPDSNPCTCTSFRPAWIPLDTAETLHLAGSPWDGAIDLVYRRGPRPVVMDHKFSSDPDQWAKKSSELIHTIQMPVYAHSQRPYYPDAREFELVHHYVSKKGVYSFQRRAVVSVDQIDERIADIVAVVARMRSVALVKDQNDVPARKGPACEAWNGCPHQSICSEFKRSTTPGAKPMALTAEEQALFDEIPAVTDAAPQSAPVVDELPPADDTDAEDAALQKQLADAQAALEAKKAKRKMKMTDTNPDGSPIVPPPTPAAPVVESVTCACGVAITPENGSKLQGGAWKHVGCPKDAPPPAPAPAPKTRQTKPKTEVPPLPPAPTAPTPLAPPVFAGESASDRAARAAAEAVANAPKPAASSPTPHEVREMQASGTLPPATGALRVVARDAQTREALANVFQSIADLIRVS